MVLLITSLCVLWVFVCYDCVSIFQKKKKKRRRHGIIMHTMSVNTII